MVDLRAAYASCERDALRHYENFPVASVLVPRAMRPHVAAIYAFARAADDFADEGARSDDERLHLLDGWACRVRQAAAASAVVAPARRGEPPNTEDIFTAVAATIHEKQLPVQLFEDLLSAFAQDVAVHRYETWTGLLDYCRRSANPVGRLVLRVAGYRDDRLDAMSDAVCTALQLTNFWQDVRLDFDRGRMYVPEEELRAHGVPVPVVSDRAMSSPAAATPVAGGLQASGVASHSTAGVLQASGMREALRTAAARTRGFFEAGQPLCSEIRGRLGYELRATWLGGVRILSRLQAAGFDPLAQRPRLGAADMPWIAWHMVRWPR